MLLTRSRIAQSETHLTGEQRARLSEADRLLLRDAATFYQAIQRAADLAAWRSKRRALASHWWWYLDVLAQLPQLPVPSEPATA